ncbi:hypothetical protein MHU86_22469 [Fragilaria crotonensis]|nr:hypothetical protein MHU86_22469 [Fragilaria crotonensis]
MLEPALEWAKDGACVLPLAGRAACDAQSFEAGAGIFPIAALRMAENCRLPETPPALSFAATEVLEFPADADADVRRKLFHRISDYSRSVNRRRLPAAVHPIRIPSDWPAASPSDGKASSAVPTAALLEFLRPVF